MSKDTTFDMRLPSSLKERAQKKARVQGRKLAVIVRALLRHWLKHDPPLDYQENHLDEGEEADSATSDDLH